MTELEANQSILLHGGPQSSRRAVLLLNKLGKSHQVAMMDAYNMTQYNILLSFIWYYRKYDEYNI